MLCLGEIDLFSVTSVSGTICTHYSVVLNTTIIASATGGEELGSSQWLAALPLSRVPLMHRVTTEPYKIFSGWHRGAARLEWQWREVVFWPFSECMAVPLITCQSVVWISVSGREDELCRFPVNAFITEFWLSFKCLSAALMESYCLVTQTDFLMLVLVGSRMCCFTSCAIFNYRCVH